MVAVLGTSRARINETRLVLFLLLSILLHWMLMHALPSLSVPPPKTDLKKPIWVDLVDYTEPEAQEPASMSPVPPPPPIPQNTVARKPVRKKPPPPKKSPRTARTVTPDPSPATPEEAREIPSAKDLIPSIQNLLAMQQSPDNPFRSLHMGPHQEGVGHLPAETLYEQYLLELKRKVERNWKVSLDLGIREGVTVIYVIVAEDGSLFSCDILKPSGMIAHDYEAMEAVKASFPLTPPPKKLLNEKGILPIRFSFHYLLTPPS